MTDKEYQIREDIKKAIQSFDGGKLYESAISFLNVLDYRSNKTDRIKPNNFTGFIDAFNISASTVNKEKALASHWEKAEFIFQVADSEINRMQTLFNDVDTNEYQSFLFFAIQLKEETYKRGDLVKITREVNLPFKMPAIILFHYGNKLTLSIIDRRLHKHDTNKDVLEKVTVIKDIDITRPQRAHIEILYDLSIDSLYKQYEFHSFAKLHEAWRATLNVSELNKNFYRELAYWYFWAIEEVKFPDDEMKDEAVRNPVNVIRLITRLIFVWFLKEKNLIPDELFNKRELDKILDYKEKTGSTYYKAVLQNLFFATLNTEMNKDVKDKEKISRTFVKRNTGVPHYFRYSRYIKQQEKFQEWMDNIPFLNGGLFECLDKRFKDSSKDIFIDGFSQQLKNETQLQVPDYLFFSEDYKEIDLNETFHTTGKKYKVRGLIDILNNYKFTIEENTPVEEEVALDPELLGKVFENLLASYNEETKSTARKLTGSFYTPREIVNYMVDESLKLYLKNKLEEKEITANIDKRLQQLFSYTGEQHLFTDKKEVDAIIEAIDNCKILDPACGSGAFPMGILHKLVFILSKIDPNNKLWKQQQYEKAKRDEALAEKMEDDKNREAALKEIEKRKDDIEKAFDSNNHELDFARKLFLIENCIYGVDIQPIAIQIAKLRFFIALIVDQKAGNSNSELNRGIRPLPNLETKFVAGDTLVIIKKPLQLSLVNFQLEKDIKDKESEIHRVREKHFRARTPDTKEKYRELDSTLRNELAVLLKDEGFSKDATEKLAKWNPYNQNKAANFFDTEWMFSIDSGFDIVIGNPPYRLLTKNNTDKHTLEFYLEEYDSLKKSSNKNLFTLFIERGTKLNAPNGVLSFIVPEGLFQTRSYEGCVAVLKQSGTVNSIVTFSDFVFENAITGNLIFNFTKQKKEKIETLSFQFDEEYNLKPAKEKGTSVTDRIKSQSQNTLKEVAGVFKGIVVQDRKEVISEKKTGKKDVFLLGKNISKWKINSFYYTNYDEIVAVGGTKAKHKHDIAPRILVRRTGDSLCCAFLEKKAITESTLYSVFSIREKFETKYLFALLNSSSLNYYIRQLMITNKQAFPQILMTDLELLPIKYWEDQSLFISLVDFILDINSSKEEIIPDTQNFIVGDYFEQVLNGCVYELYFTNEMKKAGVEILELVSKDLESVKKLSKEKAIAKIYELWQKQKNEVRERLLLMATRCPETIGVIEVSVK